MGDVLRDRCRDVDGVGEVGSDGDLLHVEDSGRVEHRAALGDCQHRDRVRHALGHQGGSVDGVDGEVALGAVAVADLFPVVEHRRFVLLTFADDDDSAHRNRADQLTHGVDGCSVATFLIAATDPASRGERTGLGDAYEFEGEVAIWRHGASGLGAGRHRFVASW